MSETKATGIVIVTNPEGVHARAAIQIAGLVRRFDADVVLWKNHLDARGTDVLQVLSLGAAPGDEVSLEATGPDAQRAVEALKDLFAGNFHDRQDSTEEVGNKP